MSAAPHEPRPARGEGDETTRWADYAREVGLAIQRQRQRLSLTQIDVAAQANVARSFYQQIESGRLANGDAVNPSLWVLVSIAQTLRTSVEELLPSGATIDPSERGAKTRQSGSSSR